MSKKNDKRNNATLAQSETELKQAKQSASECESTATLTQSVNESNDTLTELNAIRKGVSVRTIDGTLITCVNYVASEKKAINEGTASEGAMPFNRWYFVDENNNPVHPTKQSEKDYLTSPQLKRLLGINVLTTGKSVCDSLNFTRSISECDREKAHNKFNTLLAKVNDSLLQVFALCEQKGIEFNSECVTLTEATTLEYTATFTERVNMWFNSELQKAIERANEKAQKAITKGTRKASAINSFAKAFVIIETLRDLELDNETINAKLVAKGLASDTETATLIINAYDNQQSKTE